MAKKNISDLPKVFDKNANTAPKSNGLQYIFDDLSFDYYVNALTEKERTKLLSKATLDDIAKLFENIDPLDYKVAKFFGENHKTYSSNYAPYMHYILQYNMMTFFDKLEYDLVHICNTDAGKETDPIISKISCDIEKTFDAYDNACLFFVNRKNKENRIMIFVNYDVYHRRAFYRFYYNNNNPVGDIIQSSWIDFSKKNNFYKGKKIDANCGFLKLNNKLTWDDIILPVKIREKIRTNVENMFKYADIIKKNNISMRRGLIFAGASGGGKTLLCKILAKELNTTVIYVLPSHIENLEDIDRVCTMASDLSPTLLIIEDIDWIAQSREENGPSGLISEFMNKLDGIEEFDNVITIATTNLPDKVEEAVKNRPGRFDRIIKIPNPNEECCRKMLDIFTKDCKKAEELDFDALAKILVSNKKISGAHIKDLCITASILAIYEGSVDENQIAILKKSHFEEALKEIKDKDFTQLAAAAATRPIGFNQTMLPPNDTRGYESW